MKNKQKKLYVNVAASLVVFSLISASAFYLKKSYDNEQKYIFPDPETLKYPVPVPKRLFVWTDVSPPEFDPAQRQSIPHIYENHYDELPFNAEMQIFVSFVGEVFNEQPPQARCFKGAWDPQQLIDIIAEPKTKEFLEAELERVYEDRIAPTVKRIVNPGLFAKKQIFQSPILEMFMDFGGRILEADDDAVPVIIFISDGINNTFDFKQESVHDFDFDAFKETDTYRRSKQSLMGLKGVEIRWYFLKRNNYSNIVDDGKRQDFWKELAIDNGTEIDFRPLRTGN